MKKHMKQKPLQRAFKVWVLALSGTVYLGKEEPRNRNTLLGKHIIINLTENSFHLHITSTDSFLFLCGTEEFVARKWDTCLQQYLTIQRQAYKSEKQKILQPKGEERKILQLVICIKCLGCKKNWEVE
jgi:hypothetical protein